MTFERTRNPFLIAGVIRSAFDRPAMLSEGASLHDLTISEYAQYVAVRDDEGNAIGVFIGFQQSPVALDIHVALTPACRGRRAVEAMRGFFAWIERETPYVTVTGACPAYNRPMAFIARAAGMKVLAIHKDSTMRSGKLEDRLIFERRIK